MPGAHKTLLNQRDRSGYAPLHLAVLYKRTQIIDYLISENADLNLLTGSVDAYKDIKYPDRTAFALAMQGESYSCANQLFKAGANISSVEKGKPHIIHWVAENNRLDSVQKLIAIDPMLINVTDRNHRTPLLWAKINGHQEIVDFLITQGADFDLHASLWSAVSIGDSQCVRYLIAHGADLNRARLPTEHPNLEENSDSLLDLAIKIGYITISLLLMDKGAKPNHSHSTIKGKTLSELIKDNDLAVVKMLIKLNQTLLNQLDSDGYAPLHLAASRGYDEIVSFLIAQGADIDLATQLSGQDSKQEGNNYTPLDWAIRKGKKDTSLILIEAGAKANHIHTLIRGIPFVLTILGGFLDLISLYIIHDRRLLNTLDEEGFTRPYITRHWQKKVK
jgi:ankyrin repeat protein